VVELLGYRFHSTRGQIARDVERLNALVGAGSAPYQFTYEQAVNDEAYVVTTVRDALTPGVLRERPFGAERTASAR
jgi:hypothetical protein